MHLWCFHLFPMWVRSILALLLVYPQFLYLLNFGPNFLLLRWPCLASSSQSQFERQCGHKIFCAISGKFSKKFLLLFSCFSSVQISVEFCVEDSEFLFSPIWPFNKFCLINEKSSSSAPSTAILNGRGPSKFYSCCTLLPKLIQSVHFSTCGYSLSAQLFERLPNWTELSLSQLPMVGWNLGLNFLLTYDQTTRTDARTHTFSDYTRLIFFLEMVPTLVYMPAEQKRKEKAFKVLEISFCIPRSMIPALQPWNSVHDYNHMSDLICLTCMMIAWRTVELFSKLLRKWSYLHRDHQLYQQGICLAGT